MDPETELSEKILLLRRTLPQLKVVEMEMCNIESNLREAKDKFNEAAECLPFISEAVRRIDMLSRKCLLKRLMVNSATANIEAILSLVTEPDTLLDLVMEVVLQLDLPVDNVPGTVVTQLLDWPGKKMENVRIKLFLIDLLKVDVFDELTCMFG